MHNCIIVGNISHSNANEAVKHPKNNMYIIDVNCCN